MAVVQDAYRPLVAVSPSMHCSGVYLVPGGILGGVPGPGGGGTCPGTPPR